MTIQHVSGHTAPHRARLSPPRPDYDWPQSAELELWALKLRLDAACRKGESREGWVSCRILRRMMG